MLMRLPFFYGWVIVGVVFVTMGVGVNARTAFSLLFPPILDEFGWERGVTAGAFSFGFLVSAVLSPSLGRLMDRRGPRVVMEMGVGLIAAGLMLATAGAPALAALRHPRRDGGRRQRLSRLHRPGALPAQLVRAPARPGDEPRVLRRRRGLDHHPSLGAGPHRSAGWRAACWALAILMLVLLVPLNLLLRRRPEDLGLEPDGDRASARRRPPRAAGNVVDAAWAAVDWTLARAMRTARFWWIAVGYFCGLFAWYAVQVHQTKYLVEVGFSPSQARGRSGS